MVSLFIMMFVVNPSLKNDTVEDVVSLFIKKNYRVGLRFAIA